MFSFLEEALAPIQTQIKGPCSLGLPAREVLLRVLDLPTEDKAEIESMAELQMDKVSPFPVDQLQIGIEILSQRSGQSRVLVAGVPREKIDIAGNAVRNAGGYPARIDVDVMAWLHMLCEEKKLRLHGRALLLLSEEHVTTLVITEHGSPVVLRSLGRNEDPDSESSTDSIIHEIEYSLIAIETEWGGDPLVAADLFHIGDTPPILQDSIKSLCGVQPEIHSLKDFPPLSEGLVRRTVHATSRTLNLAPIQWEIDAESRKARTKLLRATALVLLVWLVTISTFLLILGNRRTALNNRQEDLARLEESAAEVRVIRDKAQFLEDYVNPTFSALENLREVTVNLPAGVDLSFMKFSKRGSLDLRGGSSNRNLIYAFQKSLEKSELFRDIKLHDVKVVKGRHVFRLTATSAEVAP